MADEQKTNLRLEIAHVLFIDIVGYSKLLVKQQSELLCELNEVVSETNEFREAESAGKLIRLPTGDGMALVFRTNPEAPVECAMGDLALQQLAAAAPTYGAAIATSYGMLKLFPFWDPLRGDPRFEKIVASLAPRTSQ